MREDIGIFPLEAIVSTGKQSTYLGNTQCRTSSGNSAYNSQQTRNTYYKQMN